MHWTSVICTVDKQLKEGGCQIKISLNSWEGFFLSCAYLFK